MATQINPHTANQIRGVILQTVAHSENRDDLWKLADELATNIHAWVQIFVKEQSTVLPAESPADVPKYQTGRTTNPKTAAWLKSIDAELDTPQPEPVSNATNDDLTETDVKTGRTQVSEPAAAQSVPDPHSLDEFESVDVGPIWTEWKINWNDYDLSRYSNPCISKYADGTIRHVETELWLISRETGELKTCDARFASDQELHIYCDPLIAAYENNRPEYVGAELEQQSEKIRNVCRDNAAARRKSRLDQFVDLWEQYPGNYKYIAEIMGVSVQTVYSYKNLSKARG